MPTKSEWVEIVETAYTKISPRDDPDSITVQNIEVVDDKTCNAIVNPPGGAGWVDDLKTAEIDGELVSLREITGTTGIGEQRVKVRIGF